MDTKQIFLNKFKNMYAYNRYTLTYTRQDKIIRVVEK